MNSEEKLIKFIKLSFILMTICLFVVITSIVFSYKIYGNRVILKDFKQMCIEKEKWIQDDNGLMLQVEQLVLNKIESKQRQALIRMTIIFIFVAIVFAILIIFIIKKGEEIFLEYKHTISDEMQKSKKQLLLLQNQNRLASMGEMLGNISHQWKQPLNTLGISISKMLLLEEDGRLTKEIMLKSFRRMEKNILYLSKTIDLFRDFFRPSQNIENFNLKEEIQNIVYIVQSSFEHSLIDISCLCSDDIYMDGDKKKLEQVILNILNNAKDAIVLNNIRDGRVELKAFRLKDEIRITVWDNALGIPKEIEDKIFEPYFTTKAKSTGTGVGLYMSKFIIENSFQGELFFKNRDGGVEFIISIPLS